MSSNELYKNPIAVDFLLATGTKTIDFNDFAGGTSVPPQYAFYKPNITKIVGVQLKTAGAAGADNNNAQNVSVIASVTAGAAGARAQYNVQVKNDLSNTDTATYTVLFVNEPKVGTLGGVTVYPC